MAEEKSPLPDPRMAGRMGQTPREWRKCPACDYDLRGAPVGSRCPECGLPMEVTVGKIDDALSLMPMPVIKRFRYGAWFSMLGLLCIAVALVLLAQWPHPLPAGCVLCVGAALWICGAWFLTPEVNLPQGAWRGFTGTSRIRKLGRYLQVAWLPFTFLLLVAFFASQTGGLQRAWVSRFEVYWWILITLTLTAGMVGLFFEVLMLCELADWVRDALAKQCVSLGLAGLSVTSFVILLIEPVSPLGFLALLVWLASAVAFGVGVFSLGLSISHSVRHAKELQDRIRRRAERNDEFYGGMIDRVRQADAALEQGKHQE